MAGKMTNVSKLFSNLRTRNIIILTGIILALVVVVGIFGLRRASQTAESGSLAKAPRVESVPGLTAPSPEVARMVTQINQAGSEEAAKKGTSFFPTFIGQGEEEENIKSTKSGANSTNASGSTIAGMPITNPTSQTSGNPSDLAASQKKLAEQQQQLSQQVQAMQQKQEQQELQQVQENMTRQAQKIMMAWGATEKGTPLQQYVELKEGEGGEAGVAGTQESVKTTTIAKTTDQEKPPAATIKAGDVMFAVLITAINSDEPGPIMAKIVSGPFKGAKLVGNIQPGPTLPGTNGPTALTLNFRSMNVPDLDNTVTINAVGIDQDTARTAVATDVDHHYFLRYGSLFASSFLQGYGQAITQSGSITFNSGTGEQTTFAQQLSPQQEFLAAFGQVGQQWGEDLGNILDRPNTIYVDSGTGLGILFLGDIAIPQ
jgi:intracellular multiplication protein IcmE